MRIKFYSKHNSHIWEDGIESSTYVFEMTADKIVLLPFSIKHLKKLFRLTYNLFCNETRDFILLEQRK